MAGLEDVETKYEVELKENVETQQDDNTTDQEDTFDISPEALGTNLPSNYYQSPRFLGTVVALSFGYMASAAGWVLSSNVLTLMNDTVGPSNNIAWVALSSTLGTAVAFLLVGRLSDIFGRRWFLIGGNMLSVVANIIAATASSVGALIAANSLNGIASAVQISFTVALPELVANKHRPLWIGGILFSAVPLLGFGPIIAQELSYNSAESWRWCFWVAFILSTLTVIILFLSYHPPTFDMLHKKRTVVGQLERFDFIGMCLFILGLILLLLGLSWGGSSYPWKSAHVITTIIVGFFTTIFFVYYDNYVHRGNPLLPIYLIRSRGYIAMTLTASVGSGVYYGMSILWPQEVKYLFKGSIVQNGFQQCVLGLGAVFGQAFGGGLIRYFRMHHRWILVASTVSLTAFSAGMVSFNPDDRAKGIALMLMACLSVGIIETASLSLAPLTCPPEDLGVTLGTLGSIRSAGGAICTAIYISVLDNKLTSITPKKISTAALAAGLPESSLPQLLASSANITGVPGINANITTAVNRARTLAAADSFRYVWYIVTAFAILSFAVACLTVKSYDSYLTDDVARKLRGKQVQAVADE